MYPSRLQLGVTVAICGGLIGSAAWAGPLLERAYTDRARYRPGETAVITVAFNNATGAAWAGTVTLQVWHRGTLAHIARQEAGPVPNGQTAEISFNWTTPPLDYRGYFVEVNANGVDHTATAIDVSSDWTRFPRYGYVTEFYDGQSAAQSAALIAQLAEDYHLNSLQFYDWMWRHEQVIRQIRPGVIADPWVDWRGASISFEVLQDLIAAGHARSVACLPYFQIYGARENYSVISGVSAAWGIYAMPNGTQQHTHDLNGAAGIWMYLFDPANLNWQNHLVAEFSDAVEMLGFDGIHLDQLGYRDPVYDYWGGTVDLASGAAFRQMLDRARSHLDGLETQVTPALGRLALTFNLAGGTAGGWGMPAVVNAAPHDFLYGEVWDNETYAGVLDFITWARGAADQKALVLAAYLNYYDSLTQFDEPSVRLADAVFSVAGAHHIELGDGSHMLAHEFFPSTAKLPSPALLTALKDYYRFITAYENLLFDRNLQGVDGGGQWLSIAGASVSSTPVGGAVWAVRRRLEDYDVLHLVNLCGNDSAWRNPANVPTPRTNLAVTYRLGAATNVAEVRLASPDSDGGAAQTLSFQTGADAIGPYVSFTVPQLQYWSTLLIRRAVTVPANDRYEAEDALKTNVAVDADHSGYSGTGFVDEFDGADDGVSFDVCVPVEATYTLRFRYANATGAAATRNVYVDGVLGGQVVMPALANWNTWGVATLGLPLRAGPRQVVVGFGGSRAINFDYLELPTPAAGLRGQYFATETFADPVRTRLDAGIDFNWGSGAPDPAMPADGYVVRWSGRVQPPVSGTYTFYTQSAGGVRLFVAGRPLIEHRAPHSLTEDGGTLALTAGQAYDLVLTYFEHDGDARIALLWEAPGVPKQAIAAAYLTPSGCAFDGQAPAVPEQLIAHQVTATGANLSWAAAADDVALGGYVVWQDGVEALRTSETAATLAGLAGEQLHTFAVQSFDIFGNVSAAGPGRTVFVTGAPRAGDADLDGDVDLDDLAVFADCLRGPQVTPAPPGPYDGADCLRAFDADADGDVDLADFGAWQPVACAVSR
jgi:dextranase